MLVAAGLSVVSFTVYLLGSPSASTSRVSLFSRVLLWVAVVVAVAFARRGGAATWVGQVAAALLAVAFMVVALVKIYTLPHEFADLDEYQAFRWGYEAQDMGLAALAFGFAGTRVAALAPRVASGVLVGAALACAVYALWWIVSPVREEAWLEWAAVAAALLAASFAARIDARLPRDR